MRTGLSKKVVVIALCGLVLSTTMGADRSADKILAEINAIKIPAAESKETAEVAKRQKLVDQKGKLILELYKASPTHPELVKLMPERWAGRSESSASSMTTKSEIEEILRKNKNEKLVAETAFYKANLTITKAGSTPKLDDVLPTIDDFAKRFPKDDRVASMLFQVANAATDKGKREDLFRRIVKDFPDSAVSKKVESRRKQLAATGKKEDRVGQAFDLEFVEAIKGTPISIEGLKGKVVVIDFWATWCGPCVAEMPKMKKLYAEYKDKGVEFIGISLDQSKDKGGLTDLKDYVAKNGIQWPQYYQGNFWQSEFSSSWGINSIPCVFLIDAEGNLASVEARGKLETMIPEYLEKAKSIKTKTASTR